VIAETSSLMGFSGDSSEHKPQNGHRRQTPSNFSGSNDYRATRAGKKLIENACLGAVSCFQFGVRQLAALVEESVRWTINAEVQ